MGKPERVSKKHVVLFVCLCVSVALVSALHRKVVHMLDLGVEKLTSFKDDKCTLLGNQKDGPFGSEDFAHIGNGLYLVAAGDLGRGVAGKDPISDRRKGAIWVVDMSVPTDAPVEQQMRKVKIQDLPSDIAFQPHGLFFSFSTSRLYAISHGLAKGGERVFIFTVVRLPSGDGTRVSSVGLKFERAVISADLQEQHGVLNDVVEGSGLGEFYVTQWLKFPIPIEGQGNPKTWEDTFHSVLNKLATASPVPVTVVHRCVFKPTLTGKRPLDSEAQCEVAASGFVMANGIAVDDTRQVYWVIDGKSVREFARQPDGSLLPTQTVALPHIGDNIEWDPQQRRLVIGTIIYALKAVEKLEGDRTVIVPGAVTVIERYTNGKLSESTDAIIHDGTKLNMISAGALSHARALLGSPMSLGVLKCELE